MFWLQQTVNYTNLEKKTLLFFLNSVLVALGATDEIMEQEKSFS